MDSNLKNKIVKEIQMKFYLPIMLLCFICLTGLIGCNGKAGPAGIQGPTGSTGPIGPGATQYIYTGNFPTPIASYTDYPVYIPEMNIDSDFLVSTSSNTITWDFSSAFFDVNPTDKKIVFHISPPQAGYYYRVVVKNYP
jgi:hypothetical protein